MSVLDRVNRQRHGQGTKVLTAGESLMGSPSSTPEVKSPVVIRLQGVMTSLNSFVINNGTSDLSRFAFLMQALTDEVIEELTDKDDEAVGVFMEQMGQVIAWIGHGDNNQLPDPIRQFAEDIQPPIPIEVS